MRFKLLYKFILIYIALGIGSFILLSTLGSRMIEHRLVKTESLRLYQEASTIAEDKNLLRSVGDEENLQNLHDALSAVSTFQGCDIWLINPTGTIYLNTAKSSSDTDPEALKDFDPLALGSRYYSVGTFFDHYKSKHLSVMVPITSNLTIRGYVAIHMPMTEIYRLREDLLGVAHILALILFAFALVIPVLLYTMVLRPLKKISEGTKKYAAGDLTHNIAVNSSDEMGRLAASLNYMSDELNKSSIYQRNFIANVSHDFRSPLTSIKGFVEAMLDGTIPPEMQEKYLRIVLSETERLTKLTNGILTLNSMDEKKNNLVITRFDINDVIRKTAAAFEGICTSRKMSIRLTLTGESLYVNADLEKIQQVLYNLIDNALKFSRDNSYIEVNTELRHEKVYISVKDHGVGIPRASLNKIWERFYKTDASRGRERKGNGLGLSIVREIINQHKQTITVVSTEGVGTEFDFSLQAAEQEDVDE